MRKLLIIILFLCYNIIGVGGTVYHISPSGSNSNTGIVTSPWLTLQYACSKVIAQGDVIHVTPGIYTESSQCVLAVGVSIEGEDRNICIIQSLVTTQYSYLITAFSGSNTNGNQHISGLRLVSATPYMAFAAIRIGYRNNVEIYNCEIVDFNWYAISIENGEQSSNFATGNKVHDCIITNSAAYVGPYSSGDSKGSINFNSQDGLQIYNNIITVDRTDGFNGNCIDGVDGFIKNLKVYNNTLKKVFVPGKSWDFAVEIWNWYEGNEFYGNNIIGSIDITRAWGKGSGSYCVWIHDNTIGQNALMASEGTRGIALEHSTNDVIIERNYLKNTSTGISVNEQYVNITTQNLRISYNIFYNIGVDSAYTNQKGWGILWGCGDCDHVATTIISNIKILNNVFIANTGVRTTMWGIELPDGGQANDVNVKNNIIINYDYCPIYARQGSLGGVTINNLFIQNNIFYNNGNNNAIRYSNITPTNNTTQNNLMSNPLFMSSMDFHLQAGSPAINAGIDVGSTLDYAKNAVNSPPDIGVYEYGVIIPLPTYSTLGKLIKSNNKLIIKK